MAPRLAVMLVSLLVLMLLAASGCSREPANETIPGVRLGMAPRDVRDRFEGAAEGGWLTSVGGGGERGKAALASDDTVLEWSATGDRTRASRARFEFHLGMLVAIRAHLREPISSQRVDLTVKTVTLRTPAAGGTDVTILARDCPTHREEAESLVAKAR